MKARYHRADYAVINLTDFPTLKKPYCRNCYRRLFSTRDLRSANLPSADSSFSEEVKDNQTEMRNDDGIGFESEDPAAVSAKPLVLAEAETMTGSPVRMGPRRSFGGARVECPRCGKAVYQAEQVRKCVCGASHR